MVIMISSINDFKCLIHLISIVSFDRDMKNAVGKPYFAAALSLVLHSKSPMVNGTKFETKITIVVRIKAEEIEIGIVMNTKNGIFFIEMNKERIKNY